MLLRTGQGWRAAPAWLYFEDCLGPLWRVMISITQLAAEKVKEIATAEGLIGQGLRLRVIGGGCAGFQYDLYFEETPTDLDERFQSNGIDLFVDPLSFQYLDGTEIDFIDGP